MSGLHRHDSANGREHWLGESLREPGFQLDRLLRSVEREAIEFALRENDGNVSKAAEMLGVNRTTLYGRIDRLED